MSLQARAFGTTGLDEIHEPALPLDDAANFDALVDRVADARFVLLGEASHATAGYYRWPAEPTQRLITDRDSSSVGEATTTGRIGNGPAGPGVL